MKLTQYIRDRTDVELERLTRDETWWLSVISHRDSGTTYEQEGGCLLCNTFDLRRAADCLVAHAEFWDVEVSYMGLAGRNGERETGAMIARLARRELGRRALAAIGELDTRTEKHELAF